MAQYKGKPLDKGNELLSVLQNYLPAWHLSRQKFVVLFVQAVLKIGVKSLLELAGAFDSSAQRASSLRRIERFLKYFEFGIHLFGRMMIKVLGIESEKVYLLLDRTEWSLGKRWVNVLMLSVYVEGMSVPIFWRVYHKKGASNQQERIEFMNAFLDHFPVLQIAYLIADREFIGKEWFSYLQQAQIPFVIRLKESFQITHQGEQKTLKVFCRDVKACRCYYKGSFKICDTDMHLSVTALAGELLILGSLQADRQIFQVYQKRWGIETLFRALKTQGFTLENTAIYEARKVEKLLFLLSLAFVWAYKTGVWLNETKPIRICKNEHREFSFFRYGLLYLQNCLLNNAQYQHIIPTIKILSGD